MTKKRVHSPIFVVGAPRSGTTLLSAMFAAHSRLSSGTETDFFHFLAQVDVGELVHEESWPQKAVDFLFSMVQAKGKASMPVNYGLNRSSVTTFLMKEEPSIQNVLRAVTEQFMAANGKSRWVEKTPRHILYLDVIRRYFPDASIIRIIRDPRDVALSIVNASWSWAPRTFSGALAMWKYCDDCSAHFFQKDKLSYTVRYEDLVTSPQRELHKICDFVEEDYESNMLDTRSSYLQVNSIEEPWKAKVAQPLDVSRTGVWKRELDRQQQAESECLLGEKLIEYGYSNSGSRLEFVKVFPHDALLKYPESREWLLKRDARIWPKLRGERSVARLYIGDADSDTWLGHTRSSRVRSALRIGYQVLVTRMASKEVFWLNQNDMNTRTGFLSCLLSMILKPLSTSIGISHVDDNALTWRINLQTQPRLGAIEPASSP